MSFSQFNFHPSIAAAVLECGYTSPTAIQYKAIPHLLQGHDLLGLAQTGTGKTAAFVLPTLQRLQDGPRKKIRALILAPTRELAEQIHENIQLMAGSTKLRSCTIFGGVSKHGQLRNIERGVEIVVACPGRLLDHLNSRTISLGDIEILILDEADQMFDKGFLPDIRRILKQVPAKRQSMVFSATMPDEIRHLVEQILTDPMTVQINHEKPAETISHAFFQVGQSRKTALLENLLQKNNMTSTLIFTRTKHKAKNLARHLQNAGFRATSIQGNLSQNQRKLAMDGFKSGRFTILVATDIAARGIDVSDISHVVNYDVPDTVEAYTHRAGRTGRAEKTGEAVTFVTAADGKIIQVVERALGAKIRREIVPGFADDAAAESAAGQRNGAPRGKKLPGSSAGKWKTRTGRAASFDFGITASSKK
jgi:ATP-dependent RNA helicase RhlE